MRARFGPAGNSESFAKQGYKSSLDVPKYLTAMGLNAFEYQCGRGVNIGAEKAAQLGAAARAADIALSLHAPYYISMSGIEEEKRLKSVEYIRQSAAAVQAMGGNRIVVHTGSCGKLPREQALALAKDTMQKAIACLDANGLSGVHICPETMGKLNQLGDLNEVIELCRLDERLIPCIDFGHLNARTMGGLKTREDFKAVFEQIENRLGLDRLRRYHAHFSKIEYTAGGEKRHLTFADTLFGPDFEPLMELTAQKNCAPVIICESAGTQAEDARAMQIYYESLV